MLADPQILLSGSIGEPAVASADRDCRGLATPALRDAAKADRLARLSIGALIAAFADALPAALAERAGARLEHWAVWTVMAASLTELWSRLKLPVTR